MKLKQKMPPYIRNN